MRNVVLPLALLSSVLADGSAHAQCAPEDKIYIDPRLVPQRPNISPNNMMGILAGKQLSPEAKAEMHRQYQQWVSPLRSHTVRARSWCTRPILVFSNIFREPLRPL